MGTNGIMERLIGSLNRIMILFHYPPLLNGEVGGGLKSTNEMRMCGFYFTPQATCPPKRLRAGGSDPQVKRSSSHAEGVTVLERSDHLEMASNWMEECLQTVVGREDTRAIEG